MGTNLKILNSRLVDEISTISFAIDAGISYKIFDKLNTGISIQNLGGKIKYSREGDNLPLTIRLGASYKFVPNLLAAVELVKIYNR